jgi:5-methylcytosine-specific restriction protein A
MIPKTILDEHIRAAVRRIDREGIPSGRGSYVYDLVLGGNRYPPKLVISWAHESLCGDELSPETFDAVEAKNYLLRGGYEIANRRQGDPDAARQAEGQKIPPEEVATPSQHIASRLRLPPANAQRMLLCVARAVRVITSLKAAWLRIYFNRPSHLRVLFGRLIVITLEGNYVWLALDESTLSKGGADLRSWRWDEPHTRPSDATGKAYPKYVRPPSRNGFYDPALDPQGAEWRAIEQAHHAYLTRVAAMGMAPDPRTANDSALLDELFRTASDPCLAGPHAADVSPYDLDRIPTGDEYAEALRELGDRVTAEHRTLFIAHYGQPGRAATATQLARCPGVANAVVTINKLYGQLGRQAAEILNIAPSRRDDGTDRWWTVWFTGQSTDAGFVWTMRSEVAKALERLRWVVQDDFMAPEEIPSTSVYIEGASSRVTVNAYERNPQARLACLRRHGSACCVCGFDFAQAYGSEFSGFIHVHHLRPLSEIRNDYVVDPESDLRPVCPNCHAALHFGGRCRSIDELKAVVSQQRGQNLSAVDAKTDASLTRCKP